jgi:hypothetical protein
MVICLITECVIYGPLQSEVIRIIKHGIGQELGEVEKLAQALLETLRRDLESNTIYMHKLYLIQINEYYRYHHDYEKTQLN